MKLTIKEIARETNETIETWNWYFTSINECLKYIKKLDSQLKKKYFKFEYMIGE